MPLDVKSVGRPLSYILKRSEMWELHLDGNTLKSSDNDHMDIMNRFGNLPIINVEKIVSKDGCSILYKIYC